MGSGSDQVRVALLGLTGTGKSTTAGLMAAQATAFGVTAARHRIAQPLYDLQALVYRVIRRPLSDPSFQDGPLLESLGFHVRRISPTFLVDDFIERIASEDAGLVINDDVRDPEDCRVLAEHGFRFLRLECREETRARRLRERSGIAPRSADAEARWAAGHRSLTSITIDNNGSIAALEQSTRRLVVEFLGRQHN